MCWAWWLVHEPASSATCAQRALQAAPGGHTAAWSLCAPCRQHDLLCGQHRARCRKHRACFHTPRALQSPSCCTVTLHRPTHLLTSCHHLLRLLSPPPPSPSPAGQARAATSPTCTARLVVSPRCWAWAGASTSRTSTSRAASESMMGERGEGRGAKGRHGAPQGGGGTLRLSAMCATPAVPSAAQEHRCVIRSTVVRLSLQAHDAAANTDSSCVPVCCRRLLPCCCFCSSPNPSPSLLHPPPLRCIEGVKFTTTTGQSMSVGAAGSYVAKALSEAYVFGFKGTAGEGHCYLAVLPACLINSGSVAMLLFDSRWTVLACAAMVPAGCWAAHSPDVPSSRQPASKPCRGGAQACSRSTVAS